jgi:hypothetical protein
MTLGQRDRRALMVLGAAAIVCLVLWMVLPAEPRAAAVANVADTIPVAAKNLSRVRQSAAAFPAEDKAQKAAAAQLAAREKGMLQADTPAQAQAQLVQIMRRLAAAQDPPIDVRPTEVGKTQPLGDSYGEVTVPVAFVCRIDQLVNLLADVTAQPELLAAGGLRITAGDAKDKLVNVRLTLSAVVPRKLVPEKRGTGLL